MTYKTMGFILLIVAFIQYWRAEADSERYLEHVIHFWGFLIMSTIYYTAKDSE